MLTSQRQESGLMSSIHYTEYSVPKRLGKTNTYKSFLIVLGVYFHTSFILASSPYAIQLLSTVAVTYWLSQPTKHDTMEHIGAF